MSIVGSGLVAAVIWAIVLVIAGAAVYSLWSRATRRTASSRTVAYAVVLAAIATALGLFSIPTGIAKVAPSQHMVNIVAAVLLGPWWATWVAFVAAVSRNITGTGTVLAFPGGMIGAFLAGWAWRLTHRLYSGATAVARTATGSTAPSTTGDTGAGGTTDRSASRTTGRFQALATVDNVGLLAAACAEIIGTSFIAAVLSGLLVAPAIMHQRATATTFVAAFLVSSLVGTIVGVAALVALRRAEVVEFDEIR
jgi:energy-coupling factor transport system ATP-binding protein